MKLTDHIYLVGSGRLGFNMTDEYDCHVFLILDGSHAVLIDAGGGRNSHLIVDEIARDGVDPSRIDQLLLTHAHADHAAGARVLSDHLGLTIWASETAAEYVRTGDEHAISLDRARTAGGYPADYIFSACEIAGVLSDGDRVQVGHLELEVIATPGHCGGHLAYALHRPGGIDVLAGDAVFAGGRILLQDIWDCSVTESCRSVERLAELSAEGLYPAHGPFSRQRGWTHLNQAVQSMAGLLPPLQLG
jgi:hydroxyacylglutathione hydrolase